VEVVKNYGVNSRPSSRRSSQARPQSRNRVGSYEIPRKPVASSKLRETVVLETLRRQPSIEYRYVDVERKSPVPEERVETYPRKVPVHFYDDILNNQRAPPRDDYRDNGRRERGSSGKEYSIEEVETVSRGPSSRDQYQEHGRRERGPVEKEYIIEEIETTNRGRPTREYYEEREIVRDPPPRDYQETSGVSRAEEARQRRRRERNATASSVAPPWEAPHVIYPTGNEEVIVVTETYEYRPKRGGSLEEERRRQEFVDRVTLDARNQANQFSAEEAARYYHADWSKPELSPPREPLRRMEHHERSYRRDRHRDAELSDSEASYEYRTGK
jgi:hypothetical protein